MTLTCSHCGGYDVELVDDNGVTDPRDGDRVEHYKCHHCGDRFTKVLRA